MKEENEKVQEESDIISQAKDFLRLASEAESENRSEAMADMKFVTGEQWPAELQNSRQIEARPCLTINKLDGFCRQVSNQQRQQRPRIKVHATNGAADKKIADVLGGLCRHIEVNSNAETAYDTAFDLAVKMGWGYWRIVTKYIREDSFDQDIYIEAIDNPFTVYMDPNSILPDGSDQDKCIISDLMSKEEFKRMYPDAEVANGFTQRGTGDDSAQWITKEDIRIAEFFRVMKKKSEIVLLSDKTTVWADKVPDSELLRKQGLTIVGSRPSHKRSVHWAKMTGNEILEERTLDGRWIPVVPVYGNVVMVGGKRKKFGLVRFGKDPQRMVNYWETAATESIALAPKAKWLMAEGQDEGHENEWMRANIAATPVLRYKQTDIDGMPAPSPQRLQPEPPPAGIFEALQVSTQNMREVLGISDPAQRISGNVSGKALNAEKQQSDNSTFHYYDNLTRSIMHTGKILLDLIPHVYDTEREARIIGDDGQPDLIVLNHRETTAEEEIINNNIAVGEYDVIMDTGPGFSSKRAEAVEAMQPLMQNPELMKVVGDLFFRNSDFPGSEVIADRLASINPLSKVDDKSEVPPAVQMQMQQLEQQLQEAQKQLQTAEQEIKFRQSIEQMKQDGENQREHMRATVKAHDVEMSNETKRADVAARDATIRHDVELRTETTRHDVEKRAETAIMVEEIKGHIALLLARMGDKQQAEAEAVERAV